MHLKANAEITVQMRKLGIEIYLFGSALNNNNPRDIDVIFVYPDKLNYLLEVHQLRDDILNELTRLTSMPIDQVTLTRDEAKQTRFIELERAIKVFPD